MHSRGVSLQSDHKWIFFFIGVGYEQIARHHCIDLAVKYKAYSAVAVHMDIFLNSQLRLTRVFFYEIDSRKLAKLCFYLLCQFLCFLN